MVEAPDNRRHDNQLANERQTEGEAPADKRDCGKARTTDVNDDPGGVANALDYGDRSVVAVATKMMSKQTLVLAPTTTMAAATITICSLSLTQQAEDCGPSCESRHKSLDNSAEGEDCRRRHDNNRRTRRWGHQPTLMSKCRL